MLVGNGSDMKAIHPVMHRLIHPMMHRLVKSKAPYIYSTYLNNRGGEERLIQGFGEETWGKETTWETQAQMGG